jgi:hypothetical protein
MPSDARADRSPAVGHALSSQIKRVGRDAHDADRGQLALEEGALRRDHRADPVQRRQHQCGPRRCR